jgi:hypothetical protein
VARVRDARPAFPPRPAEEGREGALPTIRVEKIRVEKIRVEKIRVEIETGGQAARAPHTVR